MNAKLRERFYRSAHDVVSTVWHDPHPDTPGGVLYTGDGFLDQPALYDRLFQEMGEDRLHGVLAIQVMHHGSKHNWYQGLASELSIPIAVFCSNPTGNYYHPD